jgi:hypothetical protein
MKNMLRHGYKKNTWLLLISAVFVTDFICGFKTATRELSLLLREIFDP